MSSTHTPRILLVEGDGPLARAIAEVLVAEGFSVEIASEFDAAADALGRHVFQLVVCDTLLGGPSERLFGRAVELQRRALPTPFGVISGHAITPGEPATRGFAFCLAKPFTGAELLSAIGGALGGRLGEDTPEATLIRGYFAGLAAGDWDGVAGLCDPDVVYFLPSPGPFGRFVAGREAFRRFSAETFAAFPETTFSDVAVYSLAHGLVARFVGRWRRADGATQQMAGAAVFHLKDGRIARIGVDLDEKRLEQLMSVGSCS